VTVHLYTVTWNEADMLGFFFRHYDAWVDRYVVYDDGSVDGTIERLCRHPRVEVRRFPRLVPDSFVASHRALHESCWQESRGVADWVVVTAVDEHLHVPGVPMDRYLADLEREGVTYVPALGFQMISEDVPDASERLCETRTRGAPFWQMNKLSLFDPTAIEETGFEEGRHEAAPRGRLQLPREDELLLLHYKYLGFERTRARHARLETGLGAGDRARRRGVQYGWTTEQLRADWDRTMRESVDVGAVRAADVHRVPRWWRQPGAHRAVSLVRKLRNRL